MNYLAIGDDVYFFRDGALYCRSNGLTEQIVCDGMSDDDIEYYANLAYHLECIERLTKEYTDTIFTK